MKDYNKINIKIYWSDFAISLIIFLLNFCIFYLTNNLITFCIAGIALYRLGSFTHELCHQNNNPSLKIFKVVWNYIGGLLILQPSLRFQKSHVIHHTQGLFATNKDPQYPLIYSNKKLFLGLFILLPILMPIYNYLICLFSQFKNNILERVLYLKIEFSDKDYKEINYYEFYYFCIVTLLLLVNPLLIFKLYLVSILGWCLSTLRIPLEHPLKEYLYKSTYEDQITMSYTHTNFLYVIIQPLGLRFHTLHHQYPKIPYHNLIKVYNS